MKTNYGEVPVKLSLLFKDCSKPDEELKEIVSEVLETDATIADPEIIDCEVVVDATISVEPGQLWDRNGDPGTLPSEEREYDLDKNEISRRFKALGYKVEVIYESPDWDSFKAA